MASRGFRTTRLVGESDFYLADSAVFSVGKQALAGFVPRARDLSGFRRYPDALISQPAHVFA
jgi:hypothetical protein